MRFLFSFAGGTGHFLPTTAFARVLRNRGHEILYTCQEAMLDVVASAGWRAETSGGASLLDRDKRRQLQCVDRDGEQRVVRTVFAGTIARERVQRISELIERWRPDLLVCDELDFGAAIAAEAAGLPHAEVSVIAAGGFATAETIAAPLAELRSELGLTGEARPPELLLVPAPPSFREPGDPLPATACFVRPSILEEVVAVPGGRVPAPPSARRHAYVTLGTIFPQESGDLFARVLAGLSSLQLEVTVTIGDAIDPTELGELPQAVRVERFLPSSEVLPLSDVIVSHGGSGTVVAALACGIPQVLLPIGADQPNNAERCEQLGVGSALDSLTATPAQIASATTSVLQASGFRRNAERIAAEARALPDAEHVAPLLESLADTGHCAS